MESQTQKLLFSWGKIVFACAFLFIGVYGFVLNQTGLHHSKEVFEYVYRQPVDQQTYSALVFGRSFLYILCGGLILSHRRWGPAISFVLICLTIAFLSNPLKPDLSSYDKVMNWQLTLKLIASLSGVLMLTTKGKAKSEGDQARLLDLSASSPSTTYSRNAFRSSGRLGLN